MARSSASCLFFMALCLSLLLHPAFARNHRKGKRSFSKTITRTPTLSPPAPSTSVTQPTSIAPSPTLSPATPSVPASGSLAVIVASEKGKSFTKHICELAANPAMCSKIIRSNDEKFLASLPPGTTSLLSIELSAGIAAKAVLYMTNKMTNNHIEPSATSCVDNYQDAIVAYTGAYGNFTDDPIMASKNLNVADVKIGLCEANLKSGGPDCFLPQMDETNKLLRDLIQLVSKEMLH